MKLNIGITEIDFFSHFWQVMTKIFPDTKWRVHLS